MTERVLLNTHGLRVSKPGISVLSASPADLLFDSDWAQLGQYSHQELDCNWTSGPTVREFPWGKAFPTPPIVFAWYLRSDGLVIPLPPGGNFGITAGVSGGNYREVFAESTPTVLRIKGGWSGAPPAIRIRYTVMDYNL